MSDINKTNNFTYDPNINEIEGFNINAKQYNEYEYDKKKCLKKSP